MLNCRLEGEGGGGVAQSLRFVDLVKMLKIGDGPLYNLRELDNIMS